MQPPMPSVSADAQDRNLGFFQRPALAHAADRTALVELPVGGAARHVTHAELDQAMDQVAAGLMRAGLGPGDRLLVATGNGIAFVACFFGAMRLGVQPVALNTQASAEVIAHIVHDADVAGVVADLAVVPRLRDFAGLPRQRWATGPEAPGWAPYAALVGGGEDYPAFDPPADAAAFVAYTSGSGGWPKGALLGHAGMLWSIRLAERLAPLAPDACAVAATPLYHKNAMRGVIKPYLRAGAMAVITTSFDAPLFLHALQTYGATFTSGVPAIFSRALAEIERRGGIDLPRLEAVAIGSAVVTETLAGAVEAAFGAKVKNAYGLTEAGGPLQPPADGRAVPEGSVGVPALENEVRLVDSEGGDACQEGELWVRSPAVTLGYLNRPDETAARLVDGWFRTGDRFRRDDDGFFHFLGRVDDMFNCGGENIYPKEVENLIARHPAVAEVAVAAIRHDAKGQAPAALVVPRPGHTPSEASIKAFCLEHGPAYAHPRRVLMVERLPLLGTGKIDRRQVQALLAGAADRRSG
ncbi:MAG: long-chain fatty acid--CoA ligase [Geminicoccaceae bacterium]|nr:MAG: long-chain fatty acid--CoA ligase [Geminicoccaceae bacterium]